MKDGKKESERERKHLVSYRFLHRLFLIIAIDTRRRVTEYGRVSKRATIFYDKDTFSFLSVSIWSDRILQKEDKQQKEEEKEEAAEDEEEEEEKKKKKKNE